VVVVVYEKKDPVGGGARVSFSETWVIS